MLFRRWSWDGYDMNLLDFLDVAVRYLAGSLKSKLASNIVAYNS